MFSLVYITPKQIKTHTSGYGDAIFSDFEISDLEFENRNLVLQLSHYNDGMVFSCVSPVLYSSYTERETT